MRQPPARGELPDDAEYRGGVLSANSGLARAVLALELVAIACWTAAAVLYPGGSQAHPNVYGHSFWLNYLCDLADGVARSGASNPGAIYGRLGMAAIVLALAALFACAPWLFEERARAATAVRTAGLSCAIATAGVPLSAVLSAPWLHASSILIAGPLGLAAALGVVLGTRADRLLAIAGALALVSSLVALAIYAHHVAVGASSIALPIAQRAALLLVLVWIALVALRVLRGGPAASRARRGSSPPE